MPTWVLVIVAVALFVIAINAFVNTENPVIALAGVAGAFVAAALLLIVLTGMPLWLIAAACIVGIVIFLVKGSSEDSLGYGMIAVAAAWLGYVLVLAIFTHPSISSDDFQAVGSDDLDTLEEVDARFDDSQEDVKIPPPKGQTCRYWFTSRWDWSNEDEAYELCFDEESGEFTTKDRVALEERQVPR